MVIRTYEEVRDTQQEEQPRGRMLGASAGDDGALRARRAATPRRQHCARRFGVTHCLISQRLYASHPPPRCMNNNKQERAFIEQVGPVKYVIKQVRAWLLHGDDCMAAWGRRRATKRHGSLRQPQKHPVRETQQHANTNNNNTTSARASCPTCACRAPFTSTSG